MFNFLPSIPVFHHSILPVTSWVPWGSRWVRHSAFLSFPCSSPTPSGFIWAVSNFPSPLQAFLLAPSGALRAVGFSPRREKGSCGVPGSVSSFFFFSGLFSIQTYLHPHLPSFSHLPFHRGRRVDPGRNHRSSSPPHPEGTQLLIRSRQVIVADRHFPVTGDVLLFLREERESVPHGGPSSIIMQTLSAAWISESRGIFL